MSDYTPPLRDIRFVLEHVVRLDDLARIDRFAHADTETVGGLLEEVGRLCTEVLAPTNAEGDRTGSRLEDGEVRTPEGFGRAYSAYVEAGWATIAHPEEHGGGGFPLVVGNAVKEVLTAANMALSLAPLLTTATVLALDAYGDERQQQVYLPKLVTGSWTGTMHLTEPQAGSDLGAITTTAEPREDGTYRLRGQKIFITYGEHDLTDNIVHMVLARLPDAPDGTRGISMFLVPKFLVDDDGGLGDRNDVRCVSLERKLGIHASPTCVMAFGDSSDGAVGELVGEPNQGMRQMFTMMNDARLGVGLEGVAIADRAYQQAVDYALGRHQGRAPERDGSPGRDAAGRSPIVDHADVRRMLMTMRSQIEAMRCVTYLNGAAIDRGEHLPDGDERTFHRRLADLLTPISKAWCTDLAVELTSTAIQVHGGMGYVEETGVAQHFRDARIAPIYEGTNGIQAVDLVTRKVRMEDGAFVLDVLARARAEVADLPDDVKGIRGRVTEALDTAERVTRWSLDHDPFDDDVLATAVPYLHLMGAVVGAWLLARSAAAAVAALASGGDPDLHHDKIATARFFVEHLLPPALGLAATIESGAGELFAIPAGRLRG